MDSARCAYVCAPQIRRWALWTTRSLNSGLDVSLRSMISASGWAAATRTSSSSKNCAMAALGAETTGVPEAEISKIRRAHMLGDSITELTFRNALYARYAVSIWA